MPDRDMFYQNVPYHFRDSSRLIFSLGDYELGTQECCRSVASQLREWSYNYSLEFFSEAIGVVATADLALDRLSDRRRAMRHLEQYRLKLPRLLFDSLERVAHRRLALSSPLRSGRNDDEASMTRNESIACDVLVDLAMRQIAPEILHTRIVEADAEGEVAFHRGVHELRARVPNSPAMHELARKLARGESLGTRVINLPPARPRNADQLALLHTAVD